MKTEILYGINPILEALKAKRRIIYEFFCADKTLSKRVKEIKINVEKEKIPVNKISAMDLKILTGTSHHQGVAAKVSLYPFKKFDDIINSTSSNNKPFILILDSITDTQNLGALIRTAFCVGINGIILPKNRSASPTPSVSKVSAGTLEHMPIICVTNISNTINLLKKKGVWVVGLDKNAKISLYNSDLSGPLAIVIGGEDQGIRPLVKKQCDFLINIPQQRDFNSLNASVAGGVAMYEALRQRI